MSDPDEPLSPGCMKCEPVTGKSTCFPGPCIFFRDRDTPGTRSFNIARIDRVRRGMLDTVHAPQSSPSPCSRSVL